MQAENSFASGHTLFAFLKTSHIVSLSCTFLLTLVLSSICRATETHAVSIDDEHGYAARVLDKVMKKWVPPQVRGSHTVLVKVSLDGNGRVQSCTPVRRSSLDAFDQVACSAIRAQAPYGRTSYEAPIDLFLSFRVTGNEQKIADDNTEAKAARERALALGRVEHEKAKAAADAAEQRAHAKALAAANEKGQPLPKMQPAPVAPVKQKPEDTAKQKQVAPLAQAKPKPEDAAKQKQAGKPKEALPLYGETEADGPKNLTLQKTKGHGTAERTQKYTDLLQRYLTRVVSLPKNVAPGRYPLSVLVTIQPNGKIAKAKIAGSSGNTTVDSAVVQSILVSRTVPSPPRGLGPSYTVPIIAQQPVAP